MCQSCGFSVQRQWNVSHWCVTWRRRIHQVAAVLDRTHVGTQLDIGSTGRGVGFLEEVSGRVRGTPMRHCMCHTASVYVGYIAVKRIRDIQSLSFSGKLRTTVPPPLRSAERVAAGHVSSDLWTWSSHFLTRHQQILPREVIWRVQLSPLNVNAAGLT